MANAFNSKRGHFKKIVQQVETSYNSFVHAFYAFESPMFYFYNHYNHEGDVTLIPSTMGTF
jgi:hypothetical protein